MKEVAKRFKRALSVLLVAAMVVGLMPNTSLVALATNAEVTATFNFSTDAEKYSITGKTGSADFITSTETSGGSGEYAFTSGYSFTVTAQSGYQIDSVTDDNDDISLVQSGDTYTVSAEDLNKLAADTTITITVNASATTVPVTGITISGATEVEEGSDITLSVDVQPSDATNKGVTWTSSADATATVDENGKVHGVAAGDVVITATAKDGSGVSGTYNVKVTEPTSVVNPVVTFVNGDSATLSVTTNGNVTKNDDDTYSVVSGNDITFTVSKDDCVITVKNGSATVDPTQEGGNSYTVTNITADTTITITAKANEHALASKVTPSETTGVTVSFKVGTTAATKAKKGDKVEVVIADTAASSHVYTVTAEDSAKSAVKVTEAAGKYTFTMPASNVSVTVAVATAGASIKVTKGANVDKVYYSTDYDVNASNSATWIEAGDTVKVTDEEAPVYFKADAKTKFEIDKTKVFVNGDTKTAATADVNGVYTVAKDSTKARSISFAAKNIVHSYTISATAINAIEGEKDAQIKISPDYIVAYQFAGKDKVETAPYSELVVGGSGKDADKSVTIWVNEGDKFKLAVSYTDTTTYDPEITVGADPTPIECWSEQYPYAIEAKDGDGTTTPTTVNVDLATIDTVNVTFAEDTTTHVTKIIAYVDPETHKADKTKKTDITETKTIGILPTENVQFEIETATGYAVKSIEWGDNKLENVKSGTIENVTKNITVTIKTGNDSAVINTATFDIGDANVTGVVLTDGKYEMQPEGTESATEPTTTTSNSFTFTATPKTGYKLASVTVDGVEQEINDTNKAGGTFTVDFGYVEFTKEDKTTAYKPAQGKTVAVVITTEADDNTEARFFQLATATKNDTDIIVEVTGATEYKDYYVVEKDTKEVGVKVTIPYGTKLSTAALTPADALIPISVDKDGNLAGERVGDSVVYNFKIVASLLPKATNGGTPTTLTFAKRADQATLEIPTGVNVYTFDRESGKFDNKENTPYTFDKGTTVLLELDKDHAAYTLYEVVDGKDVAVQLDSFNQTFVTVDDDAEYKLVNENLDKDYRVSVSVNSVAQKEAANGIADSVAVEGGETVTITVTDAADTPNPVALNVVTLDSKLKTTIGATTNLAQGQLVINTNKADAGKSISFDLVTVVGDKVKENKIITTFTINISDRATAVTVEGVEKDGTIEVEAGSVTKLPVKFDKDTIDSLKTLSSSMIAWNVEDGDTDYGTIVINAIDVKAGTTSKASILVDGKAIFNFNIKVIAPGLGIKSVKATSQGTTYANISFVPETISRPEDFNNNFAYEVTVTPAATSTLNKTAPANLPTKTDYYPVFIDNTSVEDMEITTADAQKVLLNAAKDASKAAWDYTLSVKMVLLSSDGKETVLASSDAVTLPVSTKNAYYEDNLKVTKKQTTVYTGQTAVVAGVKYSDNASYVDPTKVSFKVYQGELPAGGWNIRLDSEGDVIAEVPTRAYGKYTIEVLAEAENKGTSTDELYAARATVAVNVKAGINKIDKTNIPQQITVNPKKNVSVTLKPVGYSDALDKNGNSIKAASQKFTYKLAGVKDNNKANVTLKNNKLTVSKDFILSTNAVNNKFSVDVYGADFTNVDGTTRLIDTLTFEVTGEYMQPASIELVDAKGKALGTSVEYAKARAAQVIVRDKNGADITDFVKITPATGSVYVGKNDYGKSILVIKNDKAPKSVTITAKTLDGGKKSFKQKFTLGYSTSANLIGKLSGGKTSTMVETSANTWQYEGNGGFIGLTVYDGKVSNTSYAYKSQYNYTVSVKGGKLINATKTGYYFDIQPTAETTTITITNKGVKPNVKTVIVAKDLKFANAKAPKFKLVKGEKLFTNVYDVQELDYTVNTEYTAVKLTELSRSKNVDAILQNSEVGIKDGVFTLPFFGGSVTGSIKYNVVFGDVKSGNFVPATKAATLTVKISKLSSFKPYTSYTINYNNSKSVAFAGTPEIVPVTVLSVQNANINGKPNNFTKYFAATGRDNKISLNTTSINKLITDKKLKSIDEIPAEDLNGYVEYKYWNGLGNVTKTVAVSMALSGDNVEYSVVQDKACVKVYNTISTNAHIISGDNLVELSAVKAVTNGWTVKYVEDKDATTGAVKDAYVTFTSSAAKIGDNEVEFKILPKTSYQSDIDKKGITLKAVIKVEDPATYAGKLSVDTAKAVVDFNDKDASVSQLWLPADKTGSYAMTVNASDAITVEADGVQISGMKSETDGVAVAYKNDKITFTLTKSKIEAGKDIVVPITVSFAGGALPEVIEYTVKTPEVLKGINEIEAEVTAEIQGFVATKDDAAGDGSKLTTLVNKIIADNQAAGVSASAVTCTYTDNTYAAKVVLTNLALDKDNTVTIETNVLEPGTDVPQKLVDINDAVAKLNAKAAKIVGEGKVPASLTDEQKAEYLEVTSATTRFQIRAFLQSELDKYTNGADYVISMPAGEYKVVDAQAYTEGSISFDAYVNGTKLNHVFVTFKQLVDETSAE